MIRPNLKYYFTAIIDTMVDIDGNELTTPEMLTCRMHLARNSLHECSKDVTFGRLFPDLKQEIDKKLKSNPDLYVYRKFPDNN